MAPDTGLVDDYWEKKKVDRKHQRNKGFSLAHFKQIGTWSQSLAVMTYSIYPINIYEASTVCMPLPGWVQRYGRQISFLEDLDEDRDLSLSNSYTV